ncbi:Receptory region [Emericellopsis cladophorae]|uniref:RING-type E3 ubiquitin transferase n=1 Tax=Emericellopsis cladophorae TaxID=2686198 RepID=A0A9P9XWR8_9HYPO|nr:Receptory region [Emericellopsis cladophorae]KAI6778769.1 Receptory region [Emericellopsis cladophorae]
MRFKSTVPRSALVISSVVRCVLSEHGVYAEAVDELPSWATDNTLQLQLSADSTNYAVIPLSESLTLPNSESQAGNVSINGNLKAVTESNYLKFTSHDDVAYMSCDKPNDDASIDPAHMIEELMKQTPRAIVLYSTANNRCALRNRQGLRYTRILSMVDPGEATTVLSHLNGTDRGETVDVKMYGNITNFDVSEDEHGQGSHSAVAMSVLYSITGLITFLFVVIVAIGAVRAHRYPERYGPRRANGGRPRQSRAKGLARAVLDTLPIVKFGDKQQAKPDPDLEMETATTEGQYPPAERVTSQSTQQGEPSTRSSFASSHFTSTTGTGTAEDSLRCSICTDDFRVGEDVRVLPCDHQYHPQCIDPWLINVSGTCPLCRLDLRPGQNNSNGVSPAGEQALPPPLTWEFDEHDSVPDSYRHRLSRLFDVNRLRQASVEEQMEMLRQLREVRIARESPETGDVQPSEAEERQQGARFASRLRERFRISTRAQSANARC